MWDRPNVDFIQSQDVPWTSVPEDEFGSGGVQRILSRDAGDGAVTSIVRFRDPISGLLAAGGDVFVLEGHGTLNGNVVRASDYAFLRPGTVLDWRPTSRTSVYFGSFGTPFLEPPPSDPRLAIPLVATERLAWVPAGWAEEGTLEPGAAMKWLRREGPGLVLLAAMLPGWRSEQEEAHPIHEESFKLHGDIVMGTRGVMGPGAYFYRGPDVIHGPLYTRTGTMSLIRWSAPATSVFTEPPPGNDCETLANQAYDGRVPPVFQCYE
jgi:hypothetical protein